MRKRCIIWVVMLFQLALFVACSGRKSPFGNHNAPLHSHELKSIETLLETDPKTALDSLKMLKQRVELSRLTRLDANELQLREVQAHYKNRCLTESSPDLAPVVLFYDSLWAMYPDNVEVQFLLANTYYYKGVESAFANDDVAAFSDYLNALKVMQQRADWDGQPSAGRFIGLTYTRLSEILYRYSLDDAALATCRKAFEHYSSDADRAAMLRYEAAIFQAERNYDKAVAVFQEAEALVSVGDNLIQMAIGGQLFEAQQFDSAVPHLQRAFATGDGFARVDAAVKLAEISRDRGLTNDELRYTRFYVESSMMESRMASRKMEISYLYDEFNRSKTEIPSSNGEGNLTLFGILALLVIVIALMTYIIIRNRKRISHIESKITTIEQQHEQEMPDKDLETVQTMHDETRFQESLKMFLSSDIALKINKLIDGKDIMIKNVNVFPKLKLKEMDFIELVREANHCFPDFSMRLLRQYTDLNVTDLRHGCLALLGLNDAQMAVLEGISYSGSNRRTNKFIGVLQFGDNLEQALLTYLKNELLTY